jgi:hypothetical protein
MRPEVSRIAKRSSKLHQHTVLMDGITWRATARIERYARNGPHFRNRRWIRKIGVVVLVIRLMKKEMTLFRIWHMQGDRNSPKTVLSSLLSLRKARTFMLHQSLQEFKVFSARRNCPWKYRTVVLSSAAHSCMDLTSLIGRSAAGVAPIPSTNRMVTP